MGILKQVVQSPRLDAQMNSSGTGHNYIGAPSFKEVNPYGFLNCFEGDRYASVYPSVKAISYEFMKIRPFAIDNNGEPKNDEPVIRALYHPNQADSSVAFREKLAVMALTHKKTYVLVWRNENGKAKPGGEYGFAGKNIAGFTFLESPSVVRENGRTTYRVGSQEFTEDEVMVIPGGVDPSNLYSGYAPGEASRKWAKLDDYIADYQTGFFENGAVPSGQFIITASGEEDFKDTVTKMQEKHRGAGNNDNVTYTPRPIDPSSGKPADAKIEWIPFGTTNKDIDFKNIFEQANNRIDSAYGVPASIRGVGENNNYATARLDQQNFIIRTVEPLALRIYTQITHELNRITNGLGIAITFKVDVPAVAEEEREVAETKKVEVDALMLLVEKEYSLDSAVNALDLSPRYKLLKTTAEQAEIDNAQEDVDDGDEVADSPDPDQIDGVTPLNRGRAKSKSPKAEATDFDKIYAVAKSTMKGQLDKAVAEITEDDISNAVNPDPTLDEEDEFIDAMMLVITAIVLAKGADQYEAGKKLLEEAGEAVDNLNKFNFTDTAQDRYKAYLRKVAGSYMGDTAEAIRKSLANARDTQKTLAQTKKDLRDIIDVDEYRVKRLAETELNRANAMGSIESMIEIADQTGVEIEKGLLHAGADSPCQFCAVLLNRWVEVKEVFIAEGDAVIGADGGVYLNNFANNEGFDIHPNGHCLPQYRVKQ